MPEETKTNVESGNVVESDGDYLDTIKDLKEKTVDRSKYEALQAKHEKLLNMYVNGQRDEEKVEVKDPVDKDKLRRTLNSDCTNLEYWTAALELRKALIDEGEDDPFLPIGRKISPTNEDIECANRVAAVVGECIEYANGDSAIFTNELQRRTIDVPLPRR